MKRLLIFIFFIPFASIAQVNLWVNELPDTILVGKVYNMELKINASNDFSSLQINIGKPQSVIFKDIKVTDAHVYDYANIINIIWAPYSKESSNLIDLNFYIDKKFDYLPPELFFKFTVSYLINGLKGEQEYLYKYVLRRKSNVLLYLLDNQDIY